MRVWLLNLDADRELSKPLGYIPSNRVLERMTQLTRRIKALVPAGDVTLGQLLQQARRAKGARGMAWCPTPRARKLLADAGAEVGAAPSLQVLQLVNQRAFCAELGQTLPEAAYVRTRAELDEVLAARSERWGTWLLKRPFSASGGGRRELRAGDPLVEGWVSASFRQGGLQVEPMVERLLDISAHGHVDASGNCLFGQPLEQRCDARGAWLDSRPMAASALSDAEATTLRREMERVAAALSDAGYFGPFGVDAFRYRDGEQIRFNPRCEINARYTMGWAVGMAPHRPDLG